MRGQQSCAYTGINKQPSGCEPVTPSWHLGNCPWGISGCFFGGVRNIPGYVWGGMFRVLLYGNCLRNVREELSAGKCLGKIIWVGMSGKGHSGVLVWLTHTDRDIF